MDAKKRTTPKDGLDPKKVAKKIVSAIENRKNEVYIGGLKEVSAVYLKRFLPNLFARMVRKIKVR